MRREFQAEQEEQEVQDALWMKKNPWADPEVVRLARNRRTYYYIKNLWWLPYRFPSTMQERRIAANPEYKPYIRNKRSLAYLPDSRDELQISGGKISWKFRHKCWRQWEVNLPKHIDTIHPAPRWEDCCECDEYEEDILQEVIS